MWELLNEDYLYILCPIMSPIWNPVTLAADALSCLADSVLKLYSKLLCTIYIRDIGPDEALLVSHFLLL